MSTNSLAGIQRNCLRSVRAQARRRNAQIRTQTHSHRGTARTQTETPVGGYSLKQLDVSDRAFELVRVSSRQCIRPYKPSLVHADDCTQT